VLDADVLHLMLLIMTMLIYILYLYLYKTYLISHAIEIVFVTFSHVIISSNYLVTTITITLLHFVLLSLFLLHVSVFCIPCLYFLVYFVSCANFVIGRWLLSCARK
jgi:hypothetical protein